MDEEEEKAFKESYGYKAVGGGFNPSGLLAVEVMKTNYADIINELWQSREDIGGHHAEDATGDPEAGEKSRLLSIAITKAQDAQMWAVKALTWDTKKK